MKREEALRILREQSEGLVQQYHIASLSMFGSVARDEAGQDSDVDLLVEFTRPVGLFEFVELQQRLESALGCKVDLGTPRSLKPRLREQVVREAIRVA
jgi:predicted nucleotidyltransferase